MRPAPAMKMLDAATDTETGNTIRPWGTRHAFQFRGTTEDEGGGSATVKIEVSNNELDWEELLSVDLSMADENTTDHGGQAFATLAWQHYRARVSAISGTGTAVSVWMSAGGE